MSSIRRATLHNPLMKITQGISVTVLGTLLIAEKITLRKKIFVTLTKHMLANILHQDLKMSSVDLLPPMANASGAKKTSMHTTTYRSPISKNSLKT